MPPRTISTIMGYCLGDGRFGHLVFPLRRRRKVFEERKKVYVREDLGTRLRAKKGRKCLEVDGGEIVEENGEGRELRRGDARSVSGEGGKVRKEGYGK